MWRILGAGTKFRRLDAAPAILAWLAGARSVPDLEAGRLQLARAVVADEIVARADVVDAQAIGARVTLADVALEHVGVVHDIFPLAVLESALGDSLPTRLTTARWLHR